MWCLEQDRHRPDCCAIHGRVQQCFVQPHKTENYCTTVGFVQVLHKTSRCGLYRARVDFLWVLRAKRFYALLCKGPFRVCIVQNIHVSLYNGGLLEGYCTRQFVISLWYKNQFVWVLHNTAQVFCCTIIVCVMWYCATHCCTLCSLNTVGFRKSNDVLSHDPRIQLLLDALRLNHWCCRSKVGKPKT